VTIVFFPFDLIFYKEFDVDLISIFFASIFRSWRYKLLHTRRDRTHGVLNPILWPAPIAGLSGVRFQFRFFASIFGVEYINFSALAWSYLWIYKLHTWRDRTRGVVKPILWPAPIAGPSRAIWYQDWVTLAPVYLW